MDIILGTLAFGLLYVVLQYIQKIYKDRKCLEDKVLTAYREGRYKEGHPDYEHVIAHLGICKKCRERMGDF